jgi:AraC-like DNA-binding protein
MRYITIPSGRKLERYVRFFWILESGQLQAPYVFRTMADSCTELLFHYRGTFHEIKTDGKQEVSFLSGIQSQSGIWRRFVTNEPFGIFGVYLYPYAATVFLNAAPKELTGLMPDLETLLGTTGRELEERMILARNNRVRLHILSAFLKTRLEGNHIEDHPAKAAVRFVIGSKEQHRVDELAKRFHLSERHFSRVFKEYAGISPKLCMRITRFEAACSEFGQSGTKSLSRIAHEFGYYDQSHFIREFKTFSGYEPGEYFSGAAEGTEWREHETSTG